MMVELVLYGTKAERMLRNTICLQLYKELGHLNYTFGQKLLTAYVRIVVS